MSYSVIMAVYSVVGLFVAYWLCGVSIKFDWIMSRTIDEKIDIVVAAFVLMLSWPAMVIAIVISRVKR